LPCRRWFLWLGWWMLVGCFWRCGWRGTWGRRGRRRGFGSLGGWSRRRWGSRFFGVGWLTCLRWGGPCRCFWRRCRLKGPLSLVCYFHRTIDWVGERLRPLVELAQPTSSRRLS
jgi:hypothetical protein